MASGALGKPHAALQVGFVTVIMHTVYALCRAVRCAWGKAQEASSLSVLLSLYPDCMVHEVGLCLVDPAELQLRYGFSLGHLPPMGASPDGLLQRPCCVGQRADKEAPPGSPRSALVDLLEQLDHMDLGGRLAQQDVLATSAGTEDGVLEVVEIKNTCPFGKPRKRSFSEDYGLFDQGPRAQVPPTWVPQLQMEMLAAKTERAVLVTRSATKGVTVFRMERDDAYIKDMLSVLGYLHKTYVLPRRPPGGQPYKALGAQYTQFVQHTKRVAKAAVVEMHDANAHRFAPARNMRLLLDNAPCLDD